MSLYVTQEAGFVVPAGWIDASVNRLEYDRPGGSIRIGVLRAARGAKDLDALVSERLVEQRRGLPSFELLGRSARTAGGAPAVDTQATHQDASGKTYHRSLGLLVGSRFVVLVASGAEAQRADIDAMFERAAATLEVRAPSPEG